MPKKNKTSKLPFVSICTPTFNRRPFIPYMLKCFDHQTYPKERMEWIIIDDGTDKIEDLLSEVKQIKYFKYDNKMTLGKKRNVMHEKSSGDIIVYMDDDDYYPPERVSHAVEMLTKNPSALCAGSSIMNIYFKHIGKMYQFGPYGPNHATAATFAFKKELLKRTSYDESACLAEEKSFLKDYTIPFVQLDTMKTILVLSHVHNSFDKKIILEQGENQYMKKSDLRVEDFIKNKDIYNFFMEDIDKILEIYEPGKPENKMDVLNQLKELKIKREAMMLEQQKQFQQNMRMDGSQMEIKTLKEKTVYLENKITKLIKEMIELKKELQEAKNPELKKELQEAKNPELKKELENHCEETSNTNI